MTRPLATLGAFLTTLAFPILGQTVEEPPDLAALAKVGQASIKRFEKESASWTTTNLTPGGVEFKVEVLAAQTMRRMVLSAEAQGRRQEIARIIQKDGAWYVIEGPKAGKYRPFEAPFNLPAAYMYLTRSDPQFVTDAGSAAFGKYEATRNGRAIYRIPLPDASRKQIEHSIAEFDKFTKENPGQVIKPETTRAMDAARALLANGISTSIDLQSGMLTEFGAPERRTKITGFRWHDRIDPKEFATAGTNWEDITADPTSGDRNALCMIGHCGGWRPGMPSVDTDGRLLDLKAGRFRRIPFQGAMTLPGCFARNRTSVIVTGVDTEKGVMGLYEINLKTGANRQLGGDSLAAGFSLFPSLSPDGKTVAVLHKGSSGRILDVQIYLVDLVSGATKPLGEPRDTGPASWFPDGRGLLVVDRNSIDLSKPSIETICRLDLDGKLTKLFPGSSPVISGDGKHILFEDQTSRTWKTCDLSGGHVTTYADGMKGCAFPAPSPDGRNLLMMRFRSGQAPEPVIFSLDGSDGKPLTKVPGLWTSPAWR
jgi:hypothetical protein